MIRDPAVVLVDLQNDFCNPEFVGDGTDLSTVRAAIRATNDFLERYRASDRTPVFVRTTHSERSNSPPWAAKYASDGPMPCLEGTEGAAFDPALDVRPDDVVVTKHRYDGFHGTDLDLYLSSNDVERVLLGGVNTNVCIASTAYSAFNRDYRVTVLSDCTATTHVSHHEPALENIDAHVGSVHPSDEISL